VVPGQPARRQEIFCPSPPIWLSHEKFSC
jgi:hypothetical protein